LATIRADGRPANRTLSFRGFLHESHRLMFVADARSHEAVELIGSPWADACWYFPVTHEQFRIGGPTTLIGERIREPNLGAVHKDCWRELSDGARLTYALSAPGEPRNSRVPFPTDGPDLTTPLPHFCVIVLEPREVDHLEINGKPQNRWRFSCDSHGRWSAVEVNP
jgi:PPOX class probable FMN-dependent enzyme